MTSGPDGEPDDRRPRSQRRPADRPRPSVLVVVVVSCCVALVVVALAWRAGGGRWAVVETPSMGTAVTVGSLVVTSPTPLRAIRPGDVVMYRSPPKGTLYTHRVVRPVADGLEVRGDLNGGPDPYPVTTENLQGKVVAHCPGVGWVVKALPFLLLVSLLLAFGARMAPVRWRSSVRVFGTCLAIAVCGLVLRPYVRPVLRASEPDGDAIRATVVSAGMLPTRVTGSPGQHVDLLSGQVGSVLTRPDHPGGPALVVGSPHLTGWWLVVVVLACLLPLAWCLVVGLSPADADPSAGADDPAGTAT